MGKRIRGNATPSGNVSRVTADWDGSSFRCAADGREVGRLELPGGIPCHRLALVGGWFSGQMSHIEFRATPKAHRPKPIALVLEDDAHPSDDVVEKLWHLARKELPCDWAAVSLRAMCPFGTCVSPHLSRVQPDVNEPEDRCRHGVNYGLQGVLYRLGALPRLRERWREVVFDPARPHCLDVDVALASISDEVGYYAVPFVQSPGFLQEADAVSTRTYINDH